jgi:ribosomal protein L7Ae-like RNA K-turn-binding protein
VYRKLLIKEFLNLVSTKKIKNIVITKDSESNTFYKVICHLNDNTRTYLTIINNDQFLSTLEIKQNEMVLIYNYILGC